MAVVLVTGGSSGIGRATVIRLAAGGHRVFAASRNPTRGSLPAGVTPVVLDLADPSAAPGAIATVVDGAGRLDALVNNAGTGALGPIEDTDDDTAHNIFEVNLFGPLRLARAALPVMRSQGSGRIVNVTSMNDVLPAPFGGWYSASKAALASASAVLDAEVRRFGIWVTVVAPGLYRTEMSEGLASHDVAPDSPYRGEFEALMAQNTERIASAADPDEVAQAIEVCLSSDRPPHRIVVGNDAKAMVDLVAGTDANGLASLLRDFTRSLLSPEKREPR